MSPIFQGLRGNSNGSSAERTAAPLSSTTASASDVAQERERARDRTRRQRGSAETAADALRATGPIATLASARKRHDRPLRSWPRSTMGRLRRLSERGATTWRHGSREIDDKSGVPRVLLRRHQRAAEVSLHST
jgi:hypothetical protein